MEDTLGPFSATACIGEAPFLEHDVSWKLQTRAAAGTTDMILMIRFLLLQHSIEL